MRPSVTAAAAALWLAAAAAAGAQAGPTITEPEFLAPLLGAGHPTWIAARGPLAEAEAAAARARTLENPELGVTRETPGNAEQIDLTLGWQPPHPIRRRLGVAAADAAVGAARADFEVESHAVAAAMREAFAEWATTTAAAARAADRLHRLEALARREQVRADAGEASGLDARRLALAAGEARAARARAEVARLVATATARAWRPDLPADAIPELPPLPPVPPPSPPAASPAEHPRLRALRAELETARLNERLAAQVVDVPTVIGGWQRQDAGGEAVDGAILGISWTLPLLDRNRGERAAARSRVEDVEARLALADRELGSAHQGALAAYETLRDAATAAAGATADARSVVAAATRAFAAGEAPLTDLLDALRSADETELAALELHAEALAAHRRLTVLAPSAETRLPTPVPLSSPPTEPPTNPGDLP